MSETRPRIFWTDEWYGTFDPNTELFISHLRFLLLQEFTVVASHLRGFNCDLCDLMTFDPTELKTYTYGIHHFCSVCFSSLPRILTFFLFTDFFQCGSAELWAFFLLFISASCLCLFIYVLVPHTPPKPNKWLKHPVTCTKAPEISQLPDVYLSLNVNWTLSVRYFSNSRVAGWITTPWTPLGQINTFHGSLTWLPEYVGIF